MNENTKKKNKIIGISLGLLIVLIVVISSTYAYWQITAHQDDTNILKAACLDFDVEFTTGITLEDEWPLAVSDALRDLKGYKFTIKNNCDSEVNYSVGLESLFDANVTDYMSESAIALALDDNYLGTYDSLNDLTGPTKDPKASKELLTTTLGKGEVKEHILKIWIEKNASMDEQSKGFIGKIFIIGGPEIKLNATNDTCFTIDEATGEITKYDASCGESVVIPEKVNNIAVKSIDTNAFKNITYKYNYNFGIVVQGYNPVAGIIYNPEKEADLRAWAESIGFGGLTFYTEDTVQLAEGQKIQYCPDPEPGSLPECVDTDGKILKTEQSLVSIKELDLSQAKSLEKIEQFAFTNVPSDISVSDLSTIGNYPVSLTSLNFGNNDNEITIENKAFAGIDVDDLTLYATYNKNNASKEYARPFAGAKVENLIFKAGSNYSGLTSFILKNVIASELNVAEGITSMGSVVNDGGIPNYDKSQFEAVNLGKLTLPTTLNAVITVHELCDVSNIGQGRLSTIDELVINMPITSVTNGAFAGSTIKKITLPDTITEIQARAFADASIETIDLPANLKIIEGQAFNSSNLKNKLIIPASVESIGESAFSFTQISNLEIEDTSTNPSHLATIGQGAFSNTGLTNVIIPKSVNKIANYAFDIPSTGTITLKGRTDTAGMELGDSWSGQATILFQ